MGLRAGDLKDLVLPTLSVDEYKSKLGDDIQVIVTAFFVKDEDPAKDLSRFLEKGNNKILDCETSPAPTEDGYYLVFFELSRNEKFTEELLGILDEIDVLVAVNEWDFKPLHHKGTIPLTKENVVKNIVLDKAKLIKAEKKKDQDKDKKAKAKKVKEFFASSALAGVSLVENTLTLTGRGTEQFECIDFGRLHRVLARNGLTDRPLRLDEDSRWECKRIARLLGEGWDADRIDDLIVLTRPLDDTVLLVK